MASLKVLQFYYRHALLSASGKGATEMGIYAGRQHHSARRNGWLVARHPAATLQVSSVHSHPATQCQGQEQLQGHTCSVLMEASASKPHRTYTSATCYNEARS